MPPKIRRKNLTVIEQLLDAPQNYDFFQVIRLLERLLIGSRAVGAQDPALPAARNTIGQFVPPTTEIVRLSSRHALHFPSSEIHTLKATKQAPMATPWEVDVNFMGLAGSMGVLPYHYTELILKRLKQKDESLLHFLNVFNHRTLSLFYQAGIKYSLPRDYERKQLGTGIKKTGVDSTQILLSMIGLGTQGLANRLHINDDSLLFYSGLLTQRVRTAAGLKQIMADYFDLPISIQQFIGQWKELIPDVRTRLASRSEPKGQNAALAKSAMLGAKGWIAQGKIRIDIGPLNKEQFSRFAPGTTALRAMNDMVHLYLGLEHDYEFVIEVKRADLPDKICINKTSPPILGWNTWLSTSKNDRLIDSKETLRITISAQRPQ